VSVKTPVRRLAVLLPMVLASVALPTVQPTELPQLRHWVERIDPNGAPSTSPGDFGLVGVTWPAASDPVGDVSVRTSLDGTRWQPWQELDVDLGEARGKRISSSPLWVGRARFVAVRFTPETPSGAEVHMIDPGADPRPPASPALASADRPSIISRAGWGADESIRKGRPGYTSSVKFAVLHHTATGNSYGRSESAKIVRSIYAYHVQTNGWNDIGYNLLVDRHGQLFEGRAGGVDRAVVGAHSGGFNSGSTGIAVIGTFSSAGVPSAGIDALRRLLAWKLDVHHVDPRATVRVVSGGSSRYPAGTSVSIPTIAGHRQVSNTECPGDRLFSALSSLRESVRSTGLPKIYNPAVSRSALSPNGDGIADTTAFTARMDGTATWTLRLTDPLGREVLRRSGTGTTASFTWDGRNAAGTVQRHGFYRFALDAASAAGARARTADARALVADWPEGSVIKGSRPEIYRVHNNRLERFGSRPELLSHYRWEEIAGTSDAAVAAYAKGGSPGFRDGTLLRTPDAKVWLVSDGARRWIRSGNDLDRLGLRRENIVKVTSGQARVNPEGSPVNTQEPRLPNGMIVRSTTTKPVYWIRDIQRRHIPSRNVLTSWFAPEEVARVSDIKVSAHPLGPTLGFRDGTIVRRAGDAKVWVIAGGTRRHITSGAVLSALGFRRDNIRTVTSSELALHAEGTPI